MTMSSMEDHVLPETICQEFETDMCLSLQTMIMEFALREHVLMDILAQMRETSQAIRMIKLGRQDY